jgi:hypothetical protein
MRNEKTIRPRNRDAAVRVGGSVTGRRSAPVTRVAALALLLGAAAPAAAGTRVFIGGAFGFPGPYAYPGGYYPYPYAYPYPYPAYPGVGYGGAPPAGWVPGHWEWRYDPAGRRYQAWIPAHLE